MDFSGFVRGDGDALRQVMDEMTRPLLKYCYGILLNYTDAEDAVQDAYVKAYFNRRKVRSPEAFTAYIYRIAYTCSIDILRRRKPPPPASPAPARTALSPEMDAALKTLSPPDRALVYGRAVEDVDYAELAAIYQKSEASLRKRYERAKKKLAKLLEAERTHIERMKTV